MTNKAGKVPKSPIERLAGKTRKGAPNKNTAQLKEMILQALDKAGGVEYLLGCARGEKTQTAFLALIGKVLPLTIVGDKDSPLQAIVRIERVVIDPK